MSYRLTYAFDRDNIITTVIHAPEVTDLAQATDHAFSYIEGEHGSRDTLNLIAFSVVKLETKENDESLQ